jgi:hypothetical protein
VETWQTRFESEIRLAQQARQAGNEGRARVCARRAAGAALGEYFRRRGLDVRTPSAYDRLRIFENLGDIPQDVRQAAGHFLARITPEHALPVEADLIAEAVWMKERLLPGPDSAQAD